jgi:chromosomal replication initiation ATPase DnaA
MTMDERIESMKTELSEKGEVSTPGLVEQIQCAAIAGFDITKDEFFSDCRTIKVAFPRIASMAACRRLAGLPAREISTAHGKKDHGTTLNADDVFDTYRKTYWTFRRGVARMETILGITIPERSQG